jgi:uncharacterized protein with GYD domain
MECNQQEAAMKTYVLMSKLTMHGPSVVEVASRMKAGPRSRQTWLDQVAKQCPDVTFIAHYALLGGWDFMDIYEAPDPETAAKVSMICGATSAFQTESWSAIPEVRLRQLAEEVHSEFEEE